jgi:type IV pilus assembly protein PilY1
MNKRFLITLLTAALAFATAASHAEDIDLFVGSPPTQQALPNVLFIIDNTANWGGQNTSLPFANEKSALVNTFANLPVNPNGSARFNVGVMFANETGNPNNNVTGGVVRAAIRPMNSANKAKYAALFNTLDAGLDKGNGGISSLVMAEAFRYFTGGAPHGGNSKAKADYTGNTCQECTQAQFPQASKDANAAVWALPGNALSSRNANAYNPPPAENNCGKNYIIYISNGPSQDNNSVRTLSNNMLTAAGGDTTQIPVSPTGSQANPSDEWARFMSQHNLGVKVYTIDVNPGSTGQGPGWTAVLKSMASVSTGKYTAVSDGNGGAEIADAINKALSEIQAVNSVFASVSLPVSVNTQGTYLNQVYIGLFRPDPEAKPRWSGNLKQYKLGFINQELRMQDADNNSAISSLTGFITECARSFWTPSTTDNYWAFNPQGSCITPAGASSYQDSNFPDGAVVEKGAQAYVLRNTATRPLKTCSPTFASCTTLTNFNTGNSDITQSLLGAASSTERDALINWARGLNVDNEGNKGTGVMRPSSHGDTVHSRPVAINFGTDALPKVVVFYGGNDGIFRAINGNRSTAIGSTVPGAELWSFLPPEFYGKIKRIRDNTRQISFPNIPSTNIPTPQPKPYGMDGSVTAHDVDVATAWIYVTMRRGGRVMYAFNVNKVDPTDITLKWKVGCPNSGDDTGCSSGFSGIGQTWSTPKTLKASGYGVGNTPMLIMGGGYDTCEDNDPHTCANNSTAKGSKIYVLDANSGSLLKTLNTDRSVIADVFVVPDSVTGLAQHAYATDLGGNVYRINIGADAPASWTITKLASLGCATPATCANNRKFMFAPDVVKDGDEYILMLGSGDREKPLRYTSPSSNDVSNYFFTVKDDPADSAAWLASENSNCGSNVLCLDSLLAIARNSGDPDPVLLAAKKGWYLGLNAAEQVVTSAITIFGTINFSTHEPSNPNPDACTNDLGTTRLYNISFNNAASDNGTQSRYEVLPPVGLPPSPVAGLVTLDDGSTVPFCIGCTVASPLEGGEPEIPPTSGPSQPKGRVYWFIEK